MLIRFGHEIKFLIFSPTAMVLLLSPHPSIQHKLLCPEATQVEPDVNVHHFLDSNGNEAVRLIAPAGELRLYYEAVIRVDGLPERVDLDVEEWPVSQLPDKIMPYLRGSRYCEVELLSAAANQLFGDTNCGWDRVQAICDWLCSSMQIFDKFVRPSQTAFETYNSCRGAKRDLTHLAISFCRALNIPARYCVGYLGARQCQSANFIPSDFDPWFEAFLGGEWFTFDTCEDINHIGRILIARGCDAKDTAATTSFETTELMQFTTFAYEVKSSQSELYELLSQHDKK
jgi:transglutaminase-like putative cysteine protease